jgi:hypothetical protein
MDDAGEWRLRVLARNITGVPALSGDAGRRWDRTGRVSVPYEDKGGIIGMSGL